MNRIHTFSFSIVLIVTLLFAIPVEARYYDPKIGRFLQEDPVGESSPSRKEDVHTRIGNPFTISGYIKSINEINPYLYVGNNPINRIDPFGLWYIDINISWGSGLGPGITGGKIISSKGIYTYSGSGLFTPGPGASITWSFQDPSVGLNYGAQAGNWIGGQYGWDEKGNKYYEGGFVTPGGSSTVYYVDEPWNWPWVKKDCNK